MDAGLQASELSSYLHWTSGPLMTNAARRNGDSFLSADHGTPYGSANVNVAVQQQWPSNGGRLRPDHDTTLAFQVSQSLPRLPGHLGCLYSASAHNSCFHVD